MDFFFSLHVLETTEKSLKPRRLDDGAAVSSKRRDSGFCKMCCLRLTDVPNLTDTCTLKMYDLLQSSGCATGPLKTGATHSRDASIECVCDGGEMEGGSGGVTEGREAGSGQIWKHCCQGDHWRGRRQLQTVS